MRSLSTLRAWTKAREVARTAYGATIRTPLERHFGLADQIRRSAISIPANIAEGYGLGTEKQFVRCLRIALGSTYELVGHIEMARDMGLLDPEKSKKLLEDSDVLVKLLIGLLKKSARRD